MKRFLKDTEGQALAEAIVVLPVLVLLFWGLYHAHTAAFLSVQAEEAARHTAWVGSRKKMMWLNLMDRDFALERGQKALSEDGMWNEEYLEKGVDDFEHVSIGLSRSNGYIRIDSASLSVWENKTLEKFDPLGVIGLAGEALSGLFKALASALPVTRCFAQNAYARVGFKVKTPFYPPVEVRAQAYFCNRWESLLFTDLHDFFNLSAAGFIDELTQSINRIMEMFNRVIGKFHDTIDEFQDRIDEMDMDLDYGSFDDYMERWDDFLLQWNNRESASLYSAPKKSVPGKHGGEGG
jgi:hypothetical protein